MARLRWAGHAEAMYRICTAALLTYLVTTGGEVRADEMPPDTLAASETASATSIATATATARLSDDAPRLTQTDVPMPPQRSPAGYRTDASEISYRWWTRGELAHLGFGVGSVVQVTRPTGMLPGMAAPGAVQWSGSATSLLMGVRVRASERSTFYADAAIGRGLGGADADPVNGKLGFELKSARSRWDIAYSGLGLRLSGDSGMSVRLRRSGLAVNWHQSF